MEIVKEKKFKDRVKDIFEKPKAKVKKGWNWLKDNREVAIPLSVAFIGLIGTGLNVAVAKEQIALKMMDRKVWIDPKTNLSWELTRKPTNEEKQVIYSALRADEDVVEVLRSLQLI